MGSDKITVLKDGSITGITRYTRIPFEALDLSERNIMFPDDAERKEFTCKMDKPQVSGILVDAGGNDIREFRRK